MHRMAKFIMLSLFLSLFITIFPLGGDAFSQQLILETPKNKDIYRLGQVPMVRDNRISNNAVTGPSYLSIISEQEDYTVSSSNLKIRMPTIDELYERYGYNDSVDKHISFLKGMESFVRGLARAGAYVEGVVQILVEMGLPPELSYLPLIESGFRTHAYSPKRAAGMWQFIPETGRRYGLKIDSWVDERLDPIKSTIAAAKYLKDLFGMFGDWNLALAAYNAGEGKIDRAIKKTGKDDYWEIRQTRYIKKETKNYVPSFIAATAIALEPERFDLYDIQTHEVLKYDTVEIETPMDLSVVARFAGTTVSVIKELNPELKQWCTPPNVPSYTLRIPEGTKELFLANLKNAKMDGLSYVKSYKVRKGDTLSKIAKQFGTSVEAIVDLNSISKRTLISVGKTILIPVNKTLHEFGEGSDTLKPIIVDRGL